jgi:hypothetical protein
MEPGGQYIIQVDSDILLQLYQSPISSPATTEMPIDTLVVTQYILRVMFRYLDAHEDYQDIL